MTTTSRCHTNGTCCMDVTCHRRFECIQEQAAHWRVGREHQDELLGDEAADRPPVTQDGMNSVCAWAAAISTALLVGTGTLWLLWRYDAPLRGALQDLQHMASALYHAATYVAF